MQCRWFRFTGLAVVIGGIALAFSAIPLGGYGVAQTGQVKLLAFSAKATYARGEPITLLLVLKNTGNSPIGLSDQVTGTIQITSIKKDGANLPTRTSFVLSYESLSYLLKHSVKSVNPNESVPMLLASESDPELGGEALSTIQLEQQGIDQVTYYAVSSPGTYELSIVYEIPAMPGFTLPVFQGKTNEAVVSFKVTP
ncbi:hypothetical protein HYR54_00965 [Candidatus Acetothermia bacterium]|nr:hypothetical protein [Candidatus Acetothermia bacterium]MBI3660243.1 hypothetical protein [Candidatus Acetothermia bacterium]